MKEAFITKEINGGNNGKIQGNILRHNTQRLRTVNVLGNFDTRIVD